MCKLHSGVRSLTEFIKGTRKAYLGLATGRLDEERWDQGPREFHEDGKTTGAKQDQSSATASRSTGGLDAWLNSANLKEEQKDEVDLHVKMVVDKCVAKLKALKSAEEGELLPEVKTHAFYLCGEPC